MDCMTHTPTSSLSAIFFYAATGSTLAIASSNNVATRMNDVFSFFIICSVLV